MADAANRLMLQDEKHEWIGAYVDGELSSSDQRMVEKWLEAEPTCRQWYEELLELRRQLLGVRVDQAEADLGRDLSPAILAELERSPPPWATPTPGAKPSELPSYSPSSSSGSPIWNHTAARMLAAAAVIALLAFWAIPDSSRNSNDTNDTNDPTLIGTTDPNSPQESTEPKEPQPNGPPANSASEQYVAARPASFIVVEIELTPKGIRRDSVTNALRQAGVGHANGVPVRPELESALMDSRFFHAANEKPGEPSSSKASKDERDGRGNDGERQAVLHQMTYCVLNGPQLDSVWQFIASERGVGAVSNHNIDVAFLDKDLSLFEMLHNSAEMQLAAAERSGKSRDTLRTRAHRVLLTTAMQTKLGLGLRALSTPAVGLLGSVLNRGRDEGEENPNGAMASEEEDVRGQPEASEAQKRAMAAQTSGILFVVRTRPPETQQSDDGDTSE